MENEKLSFYNWLNIKYNISKKEYEEYLIEADRAILRQRYNRYLKEE